MTGRSLTPSGEDARYKFVGNERDVETNYDYLGDRYYDSRIGRELSVDPFADDAPAVSPYSYASNVSAYYNQDMGSYRYDINTTVTDLFSEKLYTQDPLNRLNEEAYPGSAWTAGSGHDTRYTYTSSGNLYETSVKDEQDIITDTYKDLFGRIVKTVHDPGGLNLTTTYNYDLSGNLTSTVDPSGKQTSYAYNTLKELTQKTSPDAGTVKYLYDKNGNVRFSMDANQAAMGEFTYNIYDGLNRLLESGEYVGSGSFTQAEADNAVFPAAGNPNKIINKSFYYDVQTDTGQQNIVSRLSKSISYREGSAYETTYYSYNDMGRVAWMLQQIPGIPDQKISYWYDLQGNITKKCVSDLGDYSLYTYYDYDNAGRLSKVSTNTVDDSSTAIQEAEYIYYATGKVKRLQLGKVQGVDYVYNERDWLQMINQQNINSSQDPGGDGSNGLPVDQFGEVIGYNLGGILGSQPQYNGNISWLM